MSLTLIIGPMKSGKSLELISLIAPFEYTKKRVAMVQPIKNVRDSNVESRLGLKRAAQKVASLTEFSTPAEVIGIDEIHMFPRTDISVLKTWLIEGKELLVSGLDLDYQGRLIPVIADILTLKPEVIIDKKAVCEICGEYDGRFTTITHNGKRIRRGLPHVVPEDGTYVFGAACRQCFFV